jgi:hypothetical protein
MTLKSAKSGSRASSNTDDLKQKEGLEITWHTDQSWNVIPCSMVHT